MAAAGHAPRAWALTCLAAALLAGGCSNSPPPRTGLSGARGPSRLISGSGVMPGDKGFSLAQGVATPRKSGDLEFDDGDLLLRVPQGGAVDLGPVDFGSLSEAPAQEYSRQAQAVVGHVYCLQLRTADGDYYAKLKITQCARHRHMGLTAGELQFDYTLQTNATRSFLPYAPQPTTQEVLAERSRLLERRRAELAKTLAEGIPQFRTTLQAHYTKVSGQLAAADNAKRPAEDNLSPQVRSTLERELRDIARQLLALEAHARRCRDTLALVASAQRQLERLAQSEHVMGEQDGKLLDEVQAIEQSAALLVETQLSAAGMKGGAIEDSQVDQKIQELRKADQLPREGEGKRPG